MGGKGQSGPVAGNDQIVQMQQQQAAQATAANEQRTARLNYGKNLVQQMFEGTPTGGTLLDLSGVGKTVAANPGTFTPLTPAQTQALRSNVSSRYATNPNAANAARSTASTPAASYNPSAAAELAAGGVTTGATPGSDGSSGTLANGYTWKQAPDTGAGTTYAIYDSAGNMVNEAASLSDLAQSKIYVGGTGGTTGGFGDDFYNKYRQSIMDYFAPQEDQQYADARSSLAASLARAGQLDSSTATMDIAKLSKQDQLNQANIASNADTQTGTLRSTIAQDEQTALNQLYSTEDPTVAANTAGNMVANAQLTKPLLNPAGALFAPITAGVGNALTGFLNPTAYINPNASGAASTSSGASGSGSTVNPNV